MRAVILIRILVGWVFVSEGIQKFLFPDTLGMGRFMKIGIPLAPFSAPFVGFVEIICGVLVLLGLFTRFAAVPLLVVILTAIGTTKIPELFHPGQGIWFMLHDARADFSMLLGLVFLLLVGPGPLSIDGGRNQVAAYRARRAANRTDPVTVPPSPDPVEPLIPTGPVVPAEPVIPAQRTIIEE